MAKRTRRPVVERLDEKIDRAGECWLWTGTLNSGGYGVMTVGSQRFVHRLMWERYNGPIPDGLELDHLCRVPACCRPEHLEPVTHAENLRRGAGGACRLICQRGHWLLGNNVRVDKNCGRRCSACALEAQRRLSARKAASSAA